MAFSSGMWRAFGSEKPAEDIQRNKASLTNLVGMLADRAAEKTGAYDNRTRSAGSDKLWSQIMASPTRLPGDSREYTVKERMERGTYVSSALVKQIANNAARLGKEMNAVEVAAERLRMATLDAFKPVNQLQVSRFFGREPSNSGSILSNLVNFVQTGAAKLVAQLTNSPQISPYRAMIQELQQMGTPDFPASRKEFWQAFGDEMLKHDGANAPQSNLLASLERRLSSMATNASARGRILSEDEIKKTVTEFVTSKFRMGQFAERVNDAKVRNMGQPEISDVIRAWKGAVSPNESRGIDQADCDWLGHELEVAIDAKRYIEQPDSGIRDGFRDFIMGKNDSRNPLSIVGNLMERIESEHAKSAPPPDMTESERFKYYQNKNKGVADINPTAGLYEMYSPREYTTKDFARMMGSDVIKPLLTEHHERMEKLNAPELNEIRQANRKVTDALSPYRVLGAQFDGLARDHDMTIERNKPQTAQDFVFGLLSPRIQNAVMERARESTAMRAMEAKLPPTPKPGASSEERGRWEQANNEYAVKLVQTAKSQLGGGANDEILNEVLPALDLFTKFQREVARLPRNPDGTISALSEKLQQIDSAARHLIRASDVLFDHVQRLELKFSDDETLGKIAGYLQSGDGPSSDPLRNIQAGTAKTSAVQELKSVTYGLREAAKEIFLGSRAWLRDSGADARQKAELETVSRDMQEILSRLKADFAEFIGPETVGSDGSSALNAPTDSKTAPPPRATGQQQAPNVTPQTNQRSTNPFDGDYDNSTSRAQQSAGQLPTGTTAASSIDTTQQTRPDPEIEWARLMNDSLEVLSKLRNPSTIDTKSLDERFNQIQLQMEVLEPSFAPQRLVELKMGYQQMMSQ